MARHLLGIKYALIFALLIVSLLSGEIARELNASPLIYIIEEGDTLESIAQRFKVSLSALVKLNRFRDMEHARTNVVRGESILIPEPDIVFAAVGTKGIEFTDVDSAQATPLDPIMPPVPLRTPVTAQAAEKVAAPQADELDDKQAGDYRKYEVQPGDTLSSLALRFDVSGASLRKLNELDSDKIRIGQVLRVPQIDFPHSAPPPRSGAPEDSEPQSSSYTVEKGDTLLGISRKTRVSIGVIRVLNELESDHLRVGQTLRISSYEEALNVVAGSAERVEAEQPDYAVQEGDTLSSISRRFDIPLDQLLARNDIRNVDQLRIGQRLKIAASDDYAVKKGDTLWSIAQRFGLSVAELQRYNSGLGELLRPGQTLRVRETLAASDLALPNVYESKEQEESEIRAREEEHAYQELEARKRRQVLKPPASLPQAPENKDRPIDLNAYFMSNHPRVLRQPNTAYYEEFTDDPLRNYQMARKLLQAFDQEIQAMPSLSDELAGYSILIDPGHGGLDPGFNSQSEDGNGNPLYIIEDEYNYDYALRLYRQLKRHGAYAGLTILSPNHGIVDSPDASRTLVSQKNEVYNSPFINQSGEYSSWPIGTTSGLNKRVQVAESFFNGTDPKKRIFISLHNDNSPWDNDGRLVLYYDDSLTIDKRGKQMAESLIPHLGKNAHMRGQNLAVLRKNSARYAVLVELRNIAHARNSWAIRNADLRQEDTEMLTGGILSFVRHLQK
ncbi:MAG: LysM peptidoglycan-binding domain-containing protein [Spirochaetota bacterium]